MWARASAPRPLRDVPPWRHPRPSCARHGTSSQILSARKRCLPNVSIFSVRSSRRWFWLIQAGFSEDPSRAVGFFYSVGSLTCEKTAERKDLCYWKVGFNCAGVATVSSTKSEAEHLPELYKLIFIILRQSAVRSVTRAGGDGLRTTGESVSIELLVFFSRFLVACLC